MIRDPFPGLTMNATTHPTPASGIMKLPVKRMGAEVENLAPVSDPAFLLSSSFVQEVFYI